MFVFALLVTASCSEVASTPPLDPALNELVRGQPGPIHYFTTRVDLDGDRHPEWIVHVVGPNVCGTGGCDTMVFKEVRKQLELIARIKLTRPPIVVADTETHGWRDLIVHVSGGGILPGHSARLRYDGRAYPTNPTVNPAEPLMGKGDFETVIPTFRSFTEGVRLR